MAAYGLWDINVTKTAELGDVLVRLLQDNPGNRNPVKELLCDMDIWWRVSKVVYNREHAASPVRGVLRDICPVYGIWHGLQGVCHCFIQGFFTFFFRLEYDCFLMDPTATRVYRYPALIVLEAHSFVLPCVSRLNSTVASGVLPLTVKIPYGRSAGRPCGNC